MQRADRSLDSRRCAVWWWQEPASSSAIQIHPYQLAYFNRFAGGPAAGSRYLDDSNIDWGQDLPSLAAWQSEHGVRPLALWYFGTDDPAGYGIRVAAVVR